MEVLSSALTVFFEAPFWVGIYERREGGKLQTCKIVFGAEPKDYEIWEFLLKNWHRLRFSPAVAVAEEHRLMKKNPKRERREIAKSLTRAGVGTKAQQALQLAREQNKLEKKQKSKTEREAEKKRKFSLRQEKKKEKHKGR